MEPLDPRVEKYLRKTIRNGCTRKKDLQARGKDFVKEVMFSNETPPNHLRRRLFPNRKKIKKSDFLREKKYRTSNIDQERLNQLVQEWNKTANVHFTPK